MKDDTRVILERYVEKAQKLREFEFDEHVKSVGLTIRAHKTDDETWIWEFGLPDVEKRDAFLLTFRMFIQMNEKISFPNIINLLKDDELSSEIREGIIMAHQAFNNFMASYSDYSVELFEGQPTRGEMLKTVLYGGLVHGNNESTVQRFEKWSRDGLRANILQQEFTAILRQILRFIRSFAEMCEKELELA